MKMLKSVILFTIAALLQPHRASTKHRFVPNVPEECQRLGYCNQALPDYPVEHVTRLIKELGLRNANQSVVEEIKPTRSQDPQEVELCAFIEKKFLPSVAQDINGTWNFIINSKMQYTQKYLVEICNKAGDPCSPVAQFPVDYHASCQQNFIAKLMLAIDHTGKKVEKEFRIPSNCYCKVQERDHRNCENVTCPLD